MQSFISQVTMHSISCERAVEIALKGISPYTDLTEIKSYGIACILGIKCKGCNFIHTMNTSSRLQTSKDKINRFDVNVRAVWGSMVTGNGASHLNELLGTMNSPGLRQATFGSIEEEIGQMWHTVLEEEMLAAGAEERRIAIENNNYNEGVPSITVIADGGWSKRSHKHTYNASGGVAIIVGKQTGKILYIGVRNKYCYICSRALNTQTEPPEHVCFKNWSASSQAMESDILVEGFKQAEKVHGLRYMQLIADGDSSVYAKFRKKYPFGFLVNTSKKKTSTRNRRNPRKIAVAKKKTTIRKDTDNSTTNKKQSSKCSNTKFVGRRIKHKWMVNEEEIWYEGTVLAAVTGKDGERLAEYDILYDGEDSSCIVNHLVEDFRDSSVQFIDL
ncbi:Hypothetical predicted protein [Mytilus galloprovincialis]|uniref:Mutator-like transposase domain-containing protein n=1 Tax=Mytilus galloprovincialis TaxID=29158 RepID=A0A8B6GJT2_MYTGA|nr:Hypothetical predicted protein [Mytilus galloprovincialis]